MKSKRTVSVTHDAYPLKQVFTIARGPRSHAHTLTLTISEHGHTGRGQCVPYARYGESLESVRQQIASLTPALEKGLGIEALQEALPAGAARNAIDCALWDLAAKQNNTSVAQLWGGAPLQAVETAFTLSLDTADAMARAAHEAASRYPVLKIKLGGGQDKERIRAVRRAAPLCKLIVDANEAWREEELTGNMLACAKAGVALVEQPLAAGKDAILAHIPHPVPVCADESVHTRHDLPGLEARYDYINIKLDKAGGLSEAMALAHAARAKGFGIMVGTMLGSSLAVAPALIPAQLADIADMDPPLLLAQDCPFPLRAANGNIKPPSPKLWG